jgi:hypothetical protein
MPRSRCRTNCTLSRPYTFRRYDSNRFRAIQFKEPETPCIENTYVRIILVSNLFGKDVRTVLPPRLKLRSRLTLQPLFAAP